MVHKKTHNGKITGHGTSGHRTPEGAHVILYGEITDAADAGRPVAFKLSEAQARKWAAGLITMADYIRAQRGGAPEPEPEPEAPTGRLAEMLGVAAPIDFTEERPGVWKTATPEDGGLLDAVIDGALANLGTSLAELRESEPGMSWNDFLATLPEAQRQCAEGPGHCEHLEHLTCCLCGYVTKECADPECDSTAYLGSDFCAEHG